jgi:pSer/pThr/pTyr-binding forkhead associated (FHA) protein
MTKNDNDRNDATDTITLLRVFLGESEIERRAFTIKASISIGRDPYTDVYLEDPTVSRLHAVIERRDKGWIVRDRSSNGTTVNGSNLAVQEHVLADKDQITVGRFRIVIEFHTDSKGSLYEQARAGGWTMDDERTIPKSA